MIQYFRTVASLTFKALGRLVPPVGTAKQTRNYPCSIVERLLRTETTAHLVIAAQHSLTCRLPRQYAPQFAAYVVH